MDTILCGIFLGLVGGGGGGRGGGARGGVVWSLSL